MSVVAGQVVQKFVVVTKLHNLIRFPKNNRYSSLQNDKFLLLRNCLSSLMNNMQSCLNISCADNSLPLID